MEFGYSETLVYVHAVVLIPAPVRRALVLVLYEYIGITVYSMCCAQEYCRLRCPERPFT